MKKISFVVGFMLLLFFIGCDKSTTQSTITTEFNPSTTSHEVMTTEPATILPTTETTIYIPTHGHDACAFYEAPVFNVVNTVVTENTFSFDIEFIETGCNGFISAIYIEDYYSHGRTLVDSLESSQTITGLESRSDYYLRVEYMSDFNELYQFSSVKLYHFRTDSGISMEADNIVYTTDSFSFELNIIDPDSVVYIRDIEVSTNGSEIAELDQLGPYTLFGLEPNTEYKIEIEYSYPIRNDSYEKVYKTKVVWITTLPDVPTLTISEVDTQETRYDFLVEFYDPDSVIFIESFALYQGDTLVSDNPNPKDAADQYYFDNLESSTEYTIKVTYSYDEGDGVQTVEYEYSFCTMEPHPMNFEITELSLSYDERFDTLSFLIEFDSLANEFVVFEVNLYHNGLVESISYPGKEFTFNDLEPDTEYLVKVVAGYNCSSDVCEDTYTKEATFRTDEMPIILIDNIITTSTSVTFDVVVNDNGFGEVLEVSLLDVDTKEVLLTISDISVLTNLEFTGLTLDTDYFIYVYYKNDSVGVGEVRELWGNYRISTDAE